MIDKWNSITKTKSLKSSLICTLSSPSALTYSSETSIKSSKTPKISSSKSSASQLLKNSLPSPFQTRNKMTKYMKSNRSPFWLSWSWKSIRWERPQPMKAEPRIFKSSRQQWNYYNKKSLSTSKPSARKSITTSWRKSWNRKTNARPISKSSSKQSNKTFKTDKRTWRHHSCKNSTTKMKQPTLKYRKPQPVTCTKSSHQNSCLKQRTWAWKPSCHLMQLNSNETMITKLWKTVFRRHWTWIWVGGCRWLRIWKGSRRISWIGIIGRDTRWWSSILLRRGTLRKGNWPLRGRLLRTRSTLVSKNYTKKTSARSTIE